MRQGIEGFGVGPCTISDVKSRNTKHCPSLVAWQNFLMYRAGPYMEKETASGARMCSDLSYRTYLSSFILVDVSWVLVKTYVRVPEVANLQH